MNTVLYFILGYAAFLGLLIAYLFRLEKKQNEIIKLIKELKGDS